MPNSFYTVVDDDGRLHVRATIGSRQELETLIGVLNRRLESGYFVKEQDNERHDDAKLDTADRTTPGIGFHAEYRARAAQAHEKAAADFDAKSGTADRTTQARSEEESTSEETGQENRAEKESR